MGCAVFCLAVSSTATAQMDASSVPPAPGPPDPSPPGSQAPPSGVPAARETLPPAEPRRESRWYGWQTLIADGGWLTMALVSRATHSEELLLASIGGYALGAPAVHAAHGRVQVGFGSLAIRLLMPLVTGAVGYSLDPPKACADNESVCNDDDGSGLGLGLVLGITAAIAFDAAVLAREDVPVKSSGGLWLHPTFTLDRNRVAAGVGGSFLGPTTHAMAACHHPITRWCALRTQ
jgi:hypothetical protein